MCNAHDHHQRYGPLVLRGLHHDYLGKQEQTGQLQLINKQINQWGVYRADMYLNGLLKLGITFFPQAWTEQQVINKVMEAYDQLYFSKTKAIAQPNEVYQLQGRTNEGIFITFFMSQEGEILAVYPEFNS